MGRLLNKEVYKAAYPLHDGEYSYTEFAKDDPRRTSNIRQVKILLISKTTLKMKRKYLFHIAFLGPTIFFLF